jgi:hypothetical protein
VGGKTGGSANLLSVPKGGGALHGIGETFSADLHTGTASFAIPMALPPGRNGFAPKISLRYSSGNGNGPFGLGWELDVPGVTRKSAKGVPRYDDSSDIFLLSGAEDLVPVALNENQNSIRYRPRTEGLFARITHHREVQSAGVDDYWEVKAKDGLVTIYGKAPTPRSPILLVLNRRGPHADARADFLRWGVKSSSSKYFMTSACDRA